MSAGLVVVAAGSSHRMGGVDKVWATIGERPVIWYSLHTLTPLVDHAVLVVRSECVERAREIAASFTAVEVVVGGSERHESVQRGLETLGSVDVVAVHDAARPFAPASLLAAGISLLQTCSGAVPVLPVVDTLKRVDPKGVVVATVGRSELRAAQTPQVFDAHVLRAAYSRWTHDLSLTDDAFVLEQCGHSVRTYPGVPEAFKITSDRDLQIVRVLFEAGLIA